MYTLRPNAQVDGPVLQNSIDDSGSLCFTPETFFIKCLNGPEKNELPYLVPRLNRPDQPVTPVEQQRCPFLAMRIQGRVNYDWARFKSVNNVEGISPHHKAPPDHLIEIPPCPQLARQQRWRKYHPDLPTLLPEMKTCCSVMWPKS